MKATNFRLGPQAAMLFPVLGFAWLFVVLAQDGPLTRKEAITYVPYVEGSEDPWIFGPRDVPLIGEERADDGTQMNTIALRLGDTAKWDRAERVGLEVLSHTAPARIKAARLIIGKQEAREEDAVFVAPATSLPTLGTTVVFDRFRAAAETLKDASNGEAVLEIVTEVPCGVSLRVQMSRGKPVSDLLWLAAETDNDSALYGSVLGWLEPSAEGVQALSRAQLVAHTWGFGRQGSWVVYFVCGMAALISLTGVFLNTNGSAGAAPMRTAVGFGLVLFGIFSVYGILSPPFQGPDEADHFLTYAEMRGDGTLQARALHLANTGHFERIKRRTDERFVSSDVSAPRADAWAPYIFAPPGARSPVAAIVWSTLGRVFKTADASASMLVLRLTNALFVSVCLVAALAVAHRFFAQEDLLLWLSMPTLIVPGVAYFGTAVSNYPFLIGGYVIQAVAVGLFWAGSKSAPVGIFPAALGAARLAGLGTGLAICSAENGVVSLPFWLIFLPFFCFSASLAPASQVQKSLSAFRMAGAFSTAFVAVFAVVAVLNNGQTLPYNLDAQLRFFLPRIIPSSVFGFVIPIIFGVALTALSAGATLLGKRIGNPSPKSASDQPQSLRWVRLATVSLGAALCAAIILFKPEPLYGIHEPDVAKPPVYAYARDVVFRFVDGFGPGRPDWCVGSTFWGWFGWMDTPMPEPLRLGLQWAAGLGLLLLILWAMMGGKQAARAFLLAGSLLAVVAAVAALAVIYYQVSYNVSSRYLVGVYLLILPMAVEGYRRATGALPPRFHSCLYATFALSLAITLVHAISWHTILKRYF